MSNTNSLGNLDRLRERMYRGEDVSSGEHVPSQTFADNHGEKEHVPEDWKHLKDLKKKQSNATRFWSRLFWVAFLFFVVAAGYSYVSLTKEQSTVSSEKITFSIETRSFTNGGEVLPIIIRAINTNNQPLVDASIILKYEGTEEIEERRSIGTIEPGITREETYDIVLFGEPGTRREIVAVLEYSVPEATSVFLKEITKDVTVRSTPIQVTFSAPSTIVAGQKYPILIEVVSQSPEVLSGVVVQVRYPEGFFVESATPESDDDRSTLWYLGDVAPGERFKIAVEGVIEGFAGEARSAQVFVGLGTPAPKITIQTPLHSTIHKVVVEEPPIIVVTAVNQDESKARVAVGSSESASVQLYWENKGSETLRNVEIRTHLSGNAFNKSGVSTTQGFYDSNDDVVIFDQTQIDALKLVEPGDRGVLSFKVRPRQLVISGNQVLEQPEVLLSTEIIGRNRDGTPFSVQNVSRKTIVVSTDVSLTKSTLYYSGGIPNQGPLPPVAGETTEFTLKWSLRNSANAVRDIRVSTRLPSYVQWTGVVSPSGENVTYAPQTRQVTWTVPSVPASTGYGTIPKEVAFQVSITPSLSQVGNSPKLTEEVTFVGVDTFTDKEISISKDEHLTRLEGDVDTNGKNGIVKASN